MSIKYILFDLDGTLLPMDQNAFTKSYFGDLAKRLLPYGYDSDELIKAIWRGSEAMVKNDGSAKNEDVFWSSMERSLGERVHKDYQVFDDYYKYDFEKSRSSCGYNPDTPYVISKLLDMGYPLILATNPLFPSVGTYARARWAGLHTDDFRLITTYDNSCHCKPNLDYYRDILAEIGADAEECLMVGNDVDEDMIANQLGMKVYLVTDCLINRKNKDISVYPNGKITGLLDYLKTL